MFQLKKARKQIGELAGQESADTNERLQLGTQNLQEGNAQHVYTHLIVVRLANGSVNPEWEAEVNQLTDALLSAIANSKQGIMVLIKTL